MSNLENYINHCFAMCGILPESAETFFSHAFGAVDSYLWTPHCDNDEVASRWETEWKPKFEKIIERI